MYRYFQGRITTSIGTLCYFILSPLVLSAEHNTGSGLNAILLYTSCVQAA